MKDCRETETCDLDNVYNVSRAYWVCKNCGRDVSLEYVLLYEALKE